VTRIIPHLTLDKWSRSDKFSQINLGNPNTAKMTAYYDQMYNPAFDVFAPDVQKAPIVINSPHSGRDYPIAFLKASRLGNLSIRKSEDFMVDQLVKGGAGHDLPFIRANFPRAFLDVNREPYELDPTMFEGKLPSHVNTSSIRVASGLGTIAKIVAEGENIYNRFLSVDEGLERIETLYKPYHAALREKLAKTHVDFGCSLLIDCHSMPSKQHIGFAKNQSDFVLGDRFGSSCHPAITTAAKIILTEMGYSVEINRPYAGGFITEHYGRPENGLHALQIEINRAIYMDETRILPLPSFTGITSDLTELFAQLMTLDWASMKGTLPLAAE